MVDNWMELLKKYAHMTMAKFYRHRGTSLVDGDRAIHYEQWSDGSIRRRVPKLRGKAAVKAAKRRKHAVGRVARRNRNA